MTIVIADIPAALGAKLIEEYLDIKKHFAMNDWGLDNCRAAGSQRLCCEYISIFSENR